MKILTAEFVKSCVSADQFPCDRLPELACVGRSNVGKSSLINALLSRKALAKVSGTPGKTRLLNFYRVATADPTLRRFSLVDLPGYGYAKVAKSVREEWGPMIEQYLTGRPELCGIVQLVDARGAQRQDETTWLWLNGLGFRPIVVATKIDKLGRAERVRCLAAIRQALQLPDAVPLVPYSSVTREGRDELWTAIREMLLSKP
ncbi:MAG: ribosome biogenesis GTP-binding protein YihA/YsxC [Nitrospiraceae bacterium]